MALNIGTLCGVLSDAASLGYKAVAISGGEPLLYRELPRLLEHAKACGLHTSLTTNGTLLDDRRLDALHDCLDLMAISLDGPPAIHNEIRESPTAFERMLAGVDRVGRAGISFGFIHTVTRRSWEHLLWTAEFAARHGAELLQLHPLEPVGRAATMLRDDEPNDDLLTRVYLLFLALTHKYRDTMKIQFDAFRKDHLLQDPEYVYAGTFAGLPPRSPAASLLGVIVVEADGTVVPVSYGFSHRYQICNLAEARLAEAWPAYVSDGYQEFRQLCRDVYKEVVAPSELPFFDWHAAVVARSHSTNVSVASL